MTLVERAKQLAYRAHAGQVDKAGRPYIEHVARVAAAVADDPWAEAVAWAHDVVEDAGFPSNWQDYPREFRECVVKLTRHPDDPPSVYYQIIRSDPIALRVKLADVADNADEARLELLDDKTAARLRKKYARAMRHLRPNASQEKEMGRKDSRRAEIEATEWAKRFKAECPTAYLDAIRLAEQVDRVVIEQRDDHSAKGDFLWAIIPEGDTDFWLDALPTKEAAVAVCREMNWLVS